MALQNNNNIDRQSNTLIIKPFLRWAGGKSLFANDIVTNFPPKNIIKNYYEPFLGAGSVFLTFKPDNAILTDLNSHLIQTFQAISSDPYLVYSYLIDFAANNSKDFYYRLRDHYNISEPSIKRAAMFIYLNKSCFNGIFRVNKKGFFNVPYGYKIKLNIPSLEHLKLLASLFNKAKIYTSDYKEAVISADKSDLVYLDPPYPPINSSSYFTHYTEERFSKKNQQEVAEIANELSERGCFVFISNADVKFIRDLYKGWYISRIERVRYISCSKVKHRVFELLIKNYNF